MGLSSVTPEPLLSDISGPHLIGQIINYTQDGSEPCLFTELMIDPPYLIDPPPDPQFDSEQTKQI